MPAVARKLPRGLQGSVLLSKNPAGPDHACAHAPDKPANGILLMAVQSLKATIDISCPVHQQQMRAFPWIAGQGRIKGGCRFQAARVAKPIHKELQGPFLFIKSGQKIFIGVQHPAVKIGQRQRAPHARWEQYDDKRKCARRMGQNLPEKMFGIFDLPQLGQRGLSAVSQ